MDPVEEIPITTDGHRLLEAAFSGAPASSFVYYLELSKKKKKKQRNTELWFPVRDLEALDVHSADRSQGSRFEEGVGWQPMFDDVLNVYFGHGVHLGVDDQPPKKRNASLVAGIGALVADVDFAAPWRTGKQLPSSRAEVKPALAEMPLAPSALVDTGRGVHVWWLLDTWLPIDPAEVLNVQQFSKDAHAGLLAPLRSRGWHVDHTPGIERVHRLPGTMHYRQGHPDPVPVSLLELHLDRRYTIDQLEAIALKSGKPGKLSGPPAPPTADHRAATSKPTPAPPSIQAKKKVHKPRTLARPVPVIDGCAVLRHIRDDAATLPEPDWFTGHLLLAEIIGGDELDHEWGARYPTYSYRETQDALDRARALLAPNCDTIEEKLLGSLFCTNCPRQGLASPPTNLGRRRTKTTSGEPRPVKISTDTKRFLDEWHEAATASKFGGRSGTTDMCLIDFVYRTCLLHGIKELDLAAAYVALWLTVTPNTAAATLKRLVTAGILRPTRQGTRLPNCYLLSVPATYEKRDKDDHWPAGGSGRGKSSQLIRGVIRGPLTGQPEGVILTWLRLHGPQTAEQLAVGLGKSAKWMRDRLHFLIGVEAVHREHGRFEAIADVGDDVIAERLGVNHDRQRIEDLLHQTPTPTPQRSPSGGYFLSFRPQKRRPPTSLQQRRSPQ